MPKNAIDLLKQDHDQVRQLLERLSDTTPRAAKTRSQLMEKIARQLQVHTQIEEEIFYPAFRDADGASHEKMFFEAKEEHRAVDSLVLPDLEKTDVQSESFSGRCKVLKELVEHHIEEEEKELFPKARKALKDTQLAELGEQMAARKKQLMKRS